MELLKFWACDINRKYTLGMKIDTSILIFWKLSSRLIGLCNFYSAKFFTIWEMIFSNGMVYSRSNTLNRKLCHCKHLNLSFTINVGANFFPFVFLFLTYLLSCILFLFALRYFVNYAPLLRAVCKFRYSLLSRPYLLPVFFLRVY